MFGNERDDDDDDAVLILKFSQRFGDDSFLNFVNLS